MGEQREPGALLVRVGGVLLTLGVIATGVALWPLVQPSVAAVPGLWFLAIGGVGLGAALAIWGVQRSARARSRQLRPAEHDS